MNISDSFSKMLESINRQGNALQEKMNELSNQEEIDNTDLIMLQYEMGMYNTTLETTSTVVKSVTDELKNIAQRI